MSLFPRFTSGEFAPLFRLMDDYTSHQLSRAAFPSCTTSVRSFQPRFDVKEAKDSYHLEGELPGIDQQNVNIEFTDAQTLSIRGRTERSHEACNRPAALADQAEQDQVGDAASDAGSYHKATVEDDDAINTVSGGDSDVQTPSSSMDGAAAKQGSEAAVAGEPPSARYWVSERSVGDFQRTFSFPTRIDQDNVKASLKNGILSILVPKAQAPVSRRIVVE